MNNRIDPRGTAWQMLAGYQGEGHDSFLEDLLTNIETAQDSGRSLVYLAHEVATLAHGLKPKERQALTLMLLAALLAMAQGSSRLPADFSGALWQSLLNTLLRNTPGGWEPKAAATAIAALLADPRLAPVLGTDAGAYKPMLLVDNCLYPQRMFRLEDTVANKIHALLVGGPAEHPSAALEAAAAEVFAPDVQGRRLDPNQQYAALTAAHLPLTLISGGPGTGKTTIIVAILRLLRRLQPGISVALAAPTGKAAFRMKESISAGLHRAAKPSAVDETLLRELPEPATLHRLLGASADGRIFKHNEWNHAPYDVIIVDEASMIDLALMNRLLHALPPAGKLILLGDADQLPSVEAGAILRDLVPDTFSARQPWRAFVQGEIQEDVEESAHPMAACAVRLKKTHRQAGDAAGESIRDLAAKAREGRGDAIFGAPNPAVRRLVPTAIAYVGVEHLTAARGEETEDFESQLHAFCSHWFETHLGAVVPLIKEPFALSADGWTANAQARLENLFALHEKHKVLCVSRVLPSGAQQLNKVLHEIFAAKARERGGHWAAGEPVLMLRNDYEREVFNGDQGVIVPIGSVEGEVSLAAVFRRDARFIPITLAALAGGIEHGYAMTVHKSQGSEFDHVALVLPRLDVPLATREIIYTAVTRAKRSVLLFGQEELLKAAVERRVMRVSGLQDRLAARRAGS